MTKAQILSAIRYHANELSTDVGALLSDSGNLLEFAHDAMEQVVLDLLGIYPSELQTYEDVSLVSGTSEYALETEFWQIIKIEKRVSGENPTEIDIVDALSMEYFTTHEETSDRPYAANIIGSNLYVYPIPSADLTDYIRVWGIRPEAVTMDDAGPEYLPRNTHRLIVYWAVGLVAIMIGQDPGPWQRLYAHRLDRIIKAQVGKYQQAPRFVKESSVERTTRDSRDRALVDLDWP